MRAGFLERLERAHAHVAASVPEPPSVAVVLGSGLGPYLETRPGSTIEYSDIPGFPTPTVQGHRGLLNLGGGAAVFSGRFHYYEGFDPDDVVLPVFLAHRLGARRLILTNAAGAIRRDLSAGSLVLIRDHLNLMGMNPLRGPAHPTLGPRFPDMSAVYPADLREVARGCSPDTLPEGVYAALAGPSYETPAEIGMLAALGADLVGMSTVPEAIAAAYLGMGVLGISCVTNMAAGVLEAPLAHDEVLAVGREVAPRLAALLDRLLGVLTGSAAPGQAEGGTRARRAPGGAGRAQGALPGERVARKARSRNE
jgi:purine-nucleoside phosphorylase